MSTVTEEQQSVIDRIAEQAENVEKIGTYTLPDAIRRGSRFTDQAYGWGTGETACALHAAALDAKALGYIK